MTTNKPEVVAWRWRKPVVNDQGEAIGATAWKLSDAPGFLPWWENDPLIRLGDYKALQAKCEKLADALQEVVDAADGDGWNVLDPSFEKQRAALAAMGQQKMTPNAPANAPTSAGD